MSALVMDNEQTEGHEEDVQRPPQLDETTTATTARQWLIVFTYACTIFGGAGPFAVYPAMQDDLHISSAAMTTIVAVQTVGITSGKVFAGFFTDHMGGRRSYLISALVLCIVLFAFSMSNSIAAVTICVAFLDFVGGNICLFSSQYSPMPSSFPI